MDTTIPGAARADAPLRLQWLQSRQRGIGSSDTPVLLCAEGTVYGKTRASLYLDKVAPVTDDWEDNPDFRRGRTYEPLALALWAQEHPTYRVERPRSPAERYGAFQWWHPTLPWLFADLDGFVVDDQGQGWVLEVKCPRMRTVRSIREEGIPDRYHVQAQHLALVAAARAEGGLLRERPPQGVVGTLVLVYDHEAVEVLPYAVPHCAVTQAAILERGGKFWADHVVPRVHPYGAPPPPVDLPVRKGAPKYTPLQGEGWAALAERWADARAARSQAEDQEAALRTTLQQALEGAGVDKALLPTGHKVSWAQEAKGTRVDLDQVRAAHPEIDLDRFRVGGGTHRVFRSYAPKE